MALIPHPCFDADEFYLDLDTSLTHLRRAPDGGLVVGTDGVAVDFNAPGNKHLTTGYSSFVWGGAVGAGILYPGADGPVSPLITGGTVTNPFQTNATLTVRGSADLAIFGPGSVSEAWLNMLATINGVSFQFVFQTGYFDSGAAQGHFSRPYVGLWTLAPGQSVNVEFVTLYEHSPLGAHAGYLRATTGFWEYSLHAV